MRLFTRLKLTWNYGHEIQGLIARDLTALIAGAGRPLRILDVGCGRTSMLARFNATRARVGCHMIGLDTHSPTIAWCRAYGFHDEYLHLDARDQAGIPDVDVIIATDLIEHFEKQEALALLGQFDRHAALAAMVLTPNGYIVNPFTGENPFMEHKCGFVVEELEGIGYTSRGLGGPKWMRGAQTIPYGPKAVSLPVLAILGPLMRGHPRLCFHLYAWKYMSGTAARVPVP